MSNVRIKMMSDEDMDRYYSDVVLIKHELEAEFLRRKISIPVVRILQGEDGLEVSGKQEKRLAS